MQNCFGMICCIKTTAMNSNKKALRWQGLYEKYRFIYLLSIFRCKYWKPRYI